MGKEKCSILEVLVRPNASKTKIREFRYEVAVIDVSAPPERGRANGELLSFLAEILDVPKCELEIVRGGTSKNKWVKVPLDRDELWAKLKRA